jgi:hypothetical protein
MIADDENLILNTTARAIDEHTPKELPRGHLGFSQIGKPDDRALWLQFRWSLPDDPEPRVRRIFRLGHALEAEIIELLSRIPGVTVHDRDPQTGQQFRFEYLGGHFSGSMDGCIKGIPEAPNTWHVLEIKTVNAKRFQELTKSGVETWSPEYFAQMQCYMGASGMERALFVAYNKDTSEIYTERVKASRMEFDGYLAKAERIISATEPPASIYSGPDAIEAKKNGATHPVYWGKELPAPNCRNCRHVRIMPGQWACPPQGLERLTIEQQRTGCPCHNYLVTLMPESTMVQEYSDCVEYRAGTSVFWNAAEGAGAFTEPVYSSKELHHMSRSGLAAELADPVISRIRGEFSAEIVGSERNGA